LHLSSYEFLVIVEVSVIIPISVVVKDIVDSGDGDRGADKRGE